MDKMVGMMLDIPAQRLQRFRKPSPESTVEEDRHAARATGTFSNLQRLLQQSLIDAEIVLDLG